MADSGETSWVCVAHVRDADLVRASLSEPSSAAAASARLPIEVARLARELAALAGPTPLVIDRELAEAASAAPPSAGELSIAERAGHCANRARILELAETEQAHLAEPRVGVLRKRAKLVRRPRRLLSRHHPRGDAANAAALVAERGAKDREHLGIQRQARSMTHVRPRDTDAPACERHRHRYRHRRGHGRRHGFRGGVGGPAPLVRERPAGHFAHGGVGHPEGVEQIGDGHRVAEIRLLGSQCGREENFEHHSASCH